MKLTAVLALLGFAGHAAAAPILGSDGVALQQRDATDVVFIERDHAANDDDALDDFDVQGNDIENEDTDDDVANYVRQILEREDDAAADEDDEDLGALDVRGPPIIGQKATDGQQDGGVRNANGGKAAKSRPNSGKAGKGASRKPGHKGGVAAKKRPKHKDGKEAKKGSGRG